MSEQKKEQPAKKTTSQEQGKGVAGTETAGAKVLAKAADTIAGDNKLMATIMKVVLSPLGIIAALCGIGFLLWRNYTLKNKLADLQKELLTAKFQIKDLEKEVKVLEDKENKSREIEHEYQEPKHILHGLSNSYERLIPEINSRPLKRKTYNTTFFD